MGKIAFVFSGQGAQYGGMGKSLYAVSPAARKIFDMADAIRPGTSKQCFEGTKEELSQTINTQPCLFALDAACAAALSEAGVKADGAAGFSLGELAALAFSNALSFEDAFRLVCQRAKLMQACAEKQKGAMAAILKLTAEEAETIINGFDNVYPVNYNCPGQLVAAGDEEQINELVKTVGASGGKAVKLNVNGAFHSPFMKPASQGLEDLLDKIDVKRPYIPVYANVTAKPYGENRKELISAQVKSPVLWQNTIENMAADGFDTFVETGAGRTLCGLIARISKTAAVYNVEDENSLNNTVNALKEKNDA